MTKYIIWVFVVASIGDILTNNIKLKPKSILHWLFQPGLVYLTGLLFCLIYLFDTWNGDYVWWAFVIVFFLLIGLDIILHKRLLKKVIHIIGCFVVMGIIFYIILYTRYELQTRFFKPCWSPDGKQIAFFMEKALYRYYPSMFSFSSPDDIWKKYYLCTMDYDGKNFRQIKQTEQATDEISWSGSGEIVYAKSEITYSKDGEYPYWTNDKKPKYVFTVDPDTGKQKKVYETINTWYLLDPWLSKDKRYLGFVYHEHKYFPEKQDQKYRDDYGIAVMDLELNKVILNRMEENRDGENYTRFYGSYLGNKIAYIDIKKRVLYTLNIETMVSIPKIIEKYEDIVNVSDGFDLNSMRGYKIYSPDRTMNTDDVFRYFNKKYGTERVKHSYLFNIFPK